MEAPWLSRIELSTHIWTHPFSQVVDRLKSEVFAYVYPAIHEHFYTFEP